MTLTREEKIEILMEHYRDFNIHDFWYELAIEDWKEKLHDEGFEDAEIFFSGFWCQGDGASFKSSVNVYRFLKNHAQAILENYIHNIFELRDLVNATGNYQYVDLTAHIDQDGHYCHENTMIAELFFTIEDGDNISHEIQEFLENNLEGWMLECAKDLARKIYSSLREEYEYLTSKEAVIESLQINDIIDLDLNFIDPDDSIYPEEETTLPQAA